MKKIEKIPIELDFTNLVQYNSQTIISIYMEYVIDTKETRGLKHSTIFRYRDLAKRINSYIGNIPLEKLTPQHLNLLYTQLAENGSNKRNGGTLSAKTILEHHRLISVTLNHACKELILQKNVAELVELPKREPVLVNYYQPDLVKQIKKSLESETFFWQVLIHLLFVTGARRGEIIGLRWNMVDFEKYQIRICNNILYSSDIGIYETTPKTRKSNRLINVPKETVQLLILYKFKSTRKNSSEWLFPQEKDPTKPIHPDSINCFLQRFSKKHNLPHLNAHAFRHTMTSILINNNADIASVSRRLGHEKISTTLNIYTHFFDSSDPENADILSNFI